MSAPTLTGIGLADRSLRIIRSGQAPSGAYLAGPVFEQYRFSWFRDGAFIAEAMDLQGQLDSSSRFHAWAARTIAGEAEGMARASEAALAGRTPDSGDYLHCRYTADGRRAEGGGHNGEDWPTFQLDGPGIWLWSLEHHLRHGGELGDEIRDVVPGTARYLAALWQTPCFDAWEEFGDRVHTSTVAAIAAGLDAAISLEPSLRSDAVIAEARAAIGHWLANGSGPYTKWPGNAEVDASLLWLVAPYELVDVNGERFSQTLESIESELISDGHGVHRYASDTFYGGGAWPVLTAARGRVLLRRGRPADRERALASARWIEGVFDGQGNLPEQVPDHALEPGRVAQWIRDWGPCATPLLWSHAAYLSLLADLADRSDTEQT